MTDFTNSRNINTGKVNTKGGDFRIGDDIHNYHFKGAEYEDLLERVKELEEMLADTTDDIKRLKYSEKLNQAQEKLNKFKKEVIELAELFQKIELDTERLKLSKKHFDAGEFKEARAILDAEKMTRELDDLLDEKERIDEKKQQNQTHLQDKANEFLILAKLTAVNYDLENWFEKAKEYFEMSIKAYTSWGNCLEAGNYFEYINDFDNAEKYYKLSLIKQQNEEEEASSLHNLAILYYYKGQPNKSEDFNLQTLKIRRLLSLKKPEIFLLETAKTLNNLGLLYFQIHEFEKAKFVYNEAEEIFKNAQINSETTYLHNLSNLLNNQAILLEGTNSLDQSVKKNLEALEIRKTLAQVNSNLYLPDLATNYGNLANVYTKLEDFKNAEVTYQEAISIYEKLSYKNPSSFLPDLGLAKANLASLYSSSKKLQEAQKNYEEALLIYQSLPHKGYSKISNLGMIYNNLGNLYSTISDINSAKKAFNESLNIREQLAKENPDIHLPDLAITKINFAVLHSNHNLSKTEAVKYAEEAVNHLIKFVQLDFAQEQLKRAFSILKSQGINIEQYLKEKFGE